MACCICSHCSTWESMLSSISKYNVKTPFIYVVPISRNTVRKLLSSSLLSVFFFNAFLKLALSCLQCQLSTQALEQTLACQKGKTGLEIAVPAALSAFLAILIFNSMCIEYLPWEKKSSWCCFCFTSTFCFLWFFFFIVRSNVLYLYKLLSQLAP